MNLATLQLQRHVVIGLDAGKLLGDMKHLDYIAAHSFGIPSDK